MDLLATADSAGTKCNLLAKGYFNTEKVLVEAMKDFLHLTQSVQKSQVSRKTNGLTGTSKTQNFLPDIQHLCDIQDFFIQKVRQIRFQDQIAFLCSFLLLQIGSKTCIPSDSVVQHFTTEQNTLDKSKINTFAPSSLIRRDLSLTGLKTM